jgi:endo-1,4-beta-xylanase
LTGTEPYGCRPLICDRPRRRSGANWWLFGLCLLTAGCGGGGEASGGAGGMHLGTADQLPPVTVASLYQLASFPIGAAVPAGRSSNGLLLRPNLQVVTERHFSGLTAENIMKPDLIHPLELDYHFIDADALLDYALANRMVFHGHVLVWHSALPSWMSNYAGDWSAMMQTHVRTIVGHYAGKVTSWDVVNEAFDDGSPVAYRNSLWLQNIGPQYIERAFVAARAADPGADLYYNDYNISGVPEKLNAVLAMVDDFRLRSIPIDGIGFQMHVDVDWPSVASISSAFAAVAERGLLVRISELDVSVNVANTATTLTNALMLRQQDRYRELIQAYLATVPPSQRGGVTVWGVSDADSWIPIYYNRLDWPLLFDSQLAPKPALQGFADAL